MMSTANTIVDSRYVYDDVQSLDHCDIKGTKTYYQDALSEYSSRSNTSPTSCSQSDIWPYQTNTASSDNTAVQFDMNITVYPTINGNSAETIVAEALPPPLAAPVGWRSVILPTSYVPNTSQPNINQSETYETLNINGSLPIIFSTPNESNRIVDDISSPSSSLLSSRNINSYNTNATMNTSFGNTLYQEPQTTLPMNSQTLITNIENQQPPPVVIHKTLPNNTVTYQQNVSVKYLQPPTPPPPGPIIIREVRPPPPPPQSPVKIRQRPVPPRTPPPIVLRERPPPVPPRLPSQVIEKLLPPPPRAPRRMIVERYEAPPPKPPDVIVERWLPYKRSDRRKIFFERVPEPPAPPREPNLLILHNPPQARIQKEFINQGVTRADPESYIQRYGAEINSENIHAQYASLVGEATRTLPPPPYPLAPLNNYHESYTSYLNGYRSTPSPQLANVWEKMQSMSPIPYSTSNYPRYDQPIPCCTQPSYRSDLNSYHSYDDYATKGGDIRTMVDMTSVWCRNYRSPLSPSYPPKTIQVNSNDELQRALSTLTSDHVPLSPYSY